MPGINYVHTTDSLLEEDLDLFSCNATMSVFPGAAPLSITSPGFPASYPPSTTCVTRIEAPLHSTITLIFDAFHIEDHPR